MNINAFVPEQIVHDRYLYLPLLGMLMLFWPAASDTLQWVLRVPSATAGRACAVAAVLLSIPLATKTVLYNRTWLTEEALWQGAVQSDPSSSANWMELGRIRKDAREYDRAIAALDKSLSIAPVTLAYVNRAEVFIEQGRFADAERDLRKVLEQFPDHFPSWERLALMYERQGNLPQSLQTLREARERVPGLKCVLTDMMAIVLVQMNRPADAIGELESVRASVADELNEHAAMALYRLGILYATTGKRSQAEQVLREFLELTAGSIDPEILRTRDEIRKAMGVR
jgi:tetratricopeptide (TPR) repeat protein